MDAPSFDQSDLDRLSVKDKQELQQFITNEQQKARIQQRMRPSPRIAPPPSLVHC